MRSVVVPIAAAVSGSPLCPVPAKLDRRSISPASFSSSQIGPPAFAMPRMLEKPQAIWIGRQSFFGSSVPAIRRFISRNNASAASPRRWCSSGVMSGTSLRHVRGVRPVTIADLLPSLAGAGAFPDGVLGWIATLSGRAGVSDSSNSAAACSPPRNGPGRRLPLVVTTAGPVISARFRPFRLGGGL